MALIIFELFFVRKCACFFEKYITFANAITTREAYKRVCQLHYPNVVDKHREKEKGKRLHYDCRKDPVV